jgi:exosortase/archaeosortase family protein
LGTQDGVASCNAVPALFVINESYMNRTNLIHYFDWKFFLRFIVLLVGFYLFTKLLIQVGKPGSFLFNAFLYDHFHFVNWMRSGILYVANLFANLIGLNSEVLSDKIIGVKGGRSLLMARQCLGLELLGFWTAFIIAHEAAWKTKLTWVLGGILMICFINCWRLAILLYSLQKNISIPVRIDHHDLFNYIAYCLIAAMCYLFYKKLIPSKVSGSGT